MSNHKTSNFRIGLTLVLIILALLTILVLCASCSADPTASEKKVHIVSTGIDYYKTEYTKLPKNINDAVQIAKCFDKASKQKSDIVYHLGSNPAKKALYDLSDGTCKLPTRAELLSTISSLKSSAPSKDVTIFYFSCHGDADSEIENTQSPSYYNDAKDKTYIVLLTDDETDIDRYRISDFLSDIKGVAGMKVLTGDFCYSGAMVINSGISVNTDEYQDTNPFKLYFSSDKINVDPSIYVMSSSQYYEPSTSGGPSILHSAFTYSILNAMGWNEIDILFPKFKGVQCTKKNFLTLSDLYSYSCDNGGVQTFYYNNKYITSYPQTSNSSFDVVLFDI